MGPTTPEHDGAPPTDGGGPKRFPALRVVAMAVTALGALVLLAALLRLSGGIEALVAASPFGLWALTPFAVAFFGLRSRTVRTGRSLGLILASGFGLALYADLLLSSRLSSTAGLAFVFIPLWQVLGCGVVLALTTRHETGDGAR
jgi:hypothetical protein